MNWLLHRWNQVINVVSTLLTVLTGIHENAILLLFIGRFANIRSRLVQGRINYNIARFDLLPSRMLPNLAEVGATYTFHRAPVRTPANLGEDRSVCLRVNSMSTTTLTQNYDDAFGARPRRDQVFLYSISTSQCEVINFEPMWFEQECVQTLFQGNATACHQHILTNFDHLKQQPDIQVGVPEDFGIAGVPFLKCRDRPLQSFKYGTDLLVMQAFWAGGSYHVEIQSSLCWARPVTQTQTSSIALFQTEAADEQASVVMAVVPGHPLVQLVSIAYAVITLFMVLKGVEAFFMRRTSVTYVPATLRHRAWWLLPFVDDSFVLPVQRQVEMVRFRAGSALAGSNRWMNDWRYITISIAESCVNIRKMYMVLEMGTWMLAKQVSVENFLFVCGALTRLTWLTCLVHTVLLRMLVIVINTLEKAVSQWSCRGTTACGALRWYFKAVALVTNFKLYSVLLLLQLYVMLLINGTTTAMRRATPFKRGVYGGFPDMAPMWQSEIACDLVVIFSVQIVAGHVVASLLLLTRLRHAVGNKMLAILQHRYVFVGWDAFVTMDALGIDPLPSSPSEAITHCCLAALTRQLHASGPSGWVQYVGDDVFTPGNACIHTGRNGKYPLVRSSRRERFVPTSCSHGNLREGPTLMQAMELGPIVRPLARSNLIVLSPRAESRWGALLLMQFTSARPETADDPENTNHNHDDQHDADPETDNDVVAVQNALYTLTRDELHALAAGTFKLSIC